MLTDVDHELIRAEEVSQIAPKIVPTQNTVCVSRRVAKQVWEVLNSQVGGWLLSTVLVGTVASVYTNVLLPYREQRKDIHSLAYELEFRAALAADA